MRLAWFSASGAPDGNGARAVEVGTAVGTEVSTAVDAAVPPANDTRLLIRALAKRHDISVIDEPRAHDFVWQHARRPFDLCVFELGGAPAHRFIPAYAVHCPGLVILRGVPRHDRALQAARLVVVPHEPVAQAIADDYPGVRVRTLTPGVEPLPSDAPPVINALNWPPDGAALTYAIAGLAAGRSVIVFDGPETADWPSLDPQTWEPRDPLHSVSRGTREGGPICVSIDPRDEAHSLHLALRRLERDPALRQRLGAAARAWWREHATVERAETAFEILLEEARTLTDAPMIDPGEGMTLARRILDDFGPGPWTEALGPSS